MKEFISPQTFSKKVNLSYDQVLRMCKLGEIETVQTPGGHFKIYVREIKRFTEEKAEYITKADYEAVVRENERLKLALEQIGMLVRVGSQA